MADLPIPFSAPMVRALLREIEAPGTGKTQTRRALDLKGFVDSPQLRVAHCGGPRDFIMGALAHAGQGDRFRTKYGVGDRLYVREHWRCSAKHDATAPRDLTPRSMTIAFEAGGSIANQDDRDDWRPSEVSYTDADWMGRFRQAMHMPRWASRITLLVTEVRVERLQDCSRADALAEGVEMETADPPFYYVPGIWPHSLTAVGIEEPGGRWAERSYAKLWDQINGPGAWAANPWVAAYTFRPILGNIDRIAA